MRRKHLAIVSMTLALAIPLTACGDSSSTTPQGNSTASAADVPAAQNAVEAAMNIETLRFPFPTEPVSTGSKRIAVISAGQQSPLSQNWARWSIEAVEAAGWTASPLMDAQLDPKKMANFIQQSVSQQYDGIMISSLDPNAMSSAIEQANGAGIPISCISCPAQGWDGKYIPVNNSNKEQADLIAKYLIAKSDGKAKVLGFPDAAYPSVVQRFEEVEKYFSEHCADCSIEMTPLSVANIYKPGPPEFTAALAKYPPGSFTDMLAPYGTASVAFAKSALQAGRTDFSISSVDTTGELIELAAEGGYPLGASPVGALEFLPWAAVDLMARKFDGQDLWDASALPVALQDNDNAHQFLPNASFAPANVDFKADFSKLWQ